MVVNKSEQIWQFLSLDGRKQLLQRSDIYELYNDDIIDDVKLNTVCNKDYKQLDYQYRHFLDLVVPYEYPILSKQEDWIMFFK